MHVNATTTLGNVDINWFYHVTRIIIFACLILALFPIYHLMKHVLNASRCCNNQSNGNIEQMKVNTEKAFIQSKIILSVSILFYISYILMCSFDALAKYLYLGMSILFCKIMYIMTGWLFVVAKVFLYNYFILRANDTFWNTAYQYNQYYIQLILPLELIIIFVIMFPVSYVFFNDVTYAVESTNINGGQICILYFAARTYDVQTIMFTIGGFIDILFSFIAVGFLLIKLLIIIQQSSTDIDYEWKKCNKSTIESHESVFDSIAQIQQQTTLLIDPDRNLSYQSNNDKNEIESDTISPSQIYGFHFDTNVNNRLLLLITKLLTLLFFEMIAMILSALLYYFTSFIFWAYVIDSCIDIYCLFLTFRFSEKYYYELFGGAKCTKCMFPFVKTLGLAYRCKCCLCFGNMNEDNINGDEESTTGKSGISNYMFITKSNPIPLDYDIFKQCCTCCYYYICCCRGFRRHCCVKCYRMRYKKQKQIYKLANKEIDLLLATSLQYKPRTDMDVWN